MHLQHKSRPQIPFKIIHKRRILSYIRKPIRIFGKTWVQTQFPQIWQWNIKTHKGFHRRTKTQLTKLHHQKSIDQTQWNKRFKHTNITLKSGLASLPRELPIAFWCRLLYQCNTTINMLWPCRQNPKLSAYEALEGAFYFVRTPWAPPGMKVFAHIKPYKRASWGFNSITGWYLGPAVKHYRSYKVVIDSTSVEKISDKVKLKHHAITIPELTSTARIIKATGQTVQPRRLPLDTWLQIQMGS